MVNSYLDFYLKNKMWFLWVFYVGIPVNITLHIFNVSFWADFTDIVIFVLAVAGFVTAILAHNKGTTK